MGDNMNNLVVKFEGKNGMIVYSEVFHIMDYYANGSLISSFLVVDVDSSLRYIGIDKVISAYPSLESAADERKRERYMEEIKGVEKFNLFLEK
jgi:hypothetical protein